MRSICIILLVIASLESFSQKEYNKAGDVPDHLFCMVERSASTNYKEWKRFLEWGLMPAFGKLADSMAIPAGQLKITFKFIVDKDGSLRDIIALQNDYGLGDLIVKVAKKYPKKWTPGEQNGEPVQSYIRQLVIFHITDDDEEEVPQQEQIVKIDPSLFKVIDEPIAALRECIAETRSSINYY